MQTKDAIFQQFVDRWVDTEYLPKTISPAPLNAAEQEIGLLPKSYRDFILAYGWVEVTLSLIETCVLVSNSITPIYEFLAPPALGKTARSLRDQGLKREFILFAANGSGDYFCFRQAESWTVRRDDSPVYLYLHDERTVNKLTANFITWIQTYAALPSSDSS